MMQSPIHGPANCSHCKEAGNYQHERERSYDQPLFPSQVFHAQIEMVQSNRSAHGC